VQPHAYIALNPINPPSTAMAMMLRFLLAASLLALASAFGSSISRFGGNALVAGVINGASMSMKKGKDNVPPQMRSQYKRQKEMQAQREQMIASSQPGDDNLPVFNLFVRTKRANLVSSQTTHVWRLTLHTLL
jgi:hypothetical protein